MPDKNLGNGGARPTIFLDTNVINELMTPVDLERAIALHMVMPTNASQETQAAARAEVLRRQANARGSLWLLMVLDSQMRATLSLAEEVIPWAERHASASNLNWAAAWIDFMAHYVCEEICPHWRRCGTSARRGGSSANDSLIVDICRARSLMVITRDQGLMRKAGISGVLAQTPESYASASDLTLDAARSQFFHRYDANVGKWTNRSGIRLSGVDDALGDAARKLDLPSYRSVQEVQKSAHTMLEGIRQNFEFMWADDATRIPYRTFFKSYVGM